MQVAETKAHVDPNANREHACSPAVLRPARGAQHHNDCHQSLVEERCGLNPAVAGKTLSSAGPFPQDWPAFAPFLWRGALERALCFVLKPL
jgi:hypothetical protein